MYQSKLLHHLRLQLLQSRRIQYQVLHQRLRLRQVRLLDFFVVSQLVWFLATDYFDDFDDFPDIDVDQMIQQHRNDSSPPPAGSTFNGVTEKRIYLFLILV